MRNNNIRGNKKGGTVGDLINGTGGLIVLVLIVFVIVSTLLGANLLRSTATTTTVNNESGYVNSTGYTLSAFNWNDRSFTIVQVTNRTGGQVIAADKYSLTNGIVTNATAKVYASVNITYTYIARTDYEVTADSLSGNMTSGVDNVSSKIPTILLIAAVVLLFGVIVLLVRRSQEMGIGGSGGSL